MAFKILFTGNTFSKEEMDLLQIEGYKVIPAADNLSESALIQKLKGIDAYIVGGKEIVNAKVIQSVSKTLKLITNYGIGTGSIDIEAAKKFKITVTNTLKVSTYSVAEFTTALLLTLNKRVIEYNGESRKGLWIKKESYDLKNKTLGIIGMGTIGSYTARILKNGFNMKVLYTDITQRFSIEEEMGAKKVDLKTLLKNSDVVSIHAPLNDTTRNMISRNELKLMKKSAILINTARAWLVNPEDLFLALKNNEILAAGYDGFYSEPLDLNLPEAKLLNLPDFKFVLTPHTGYDAYENPDKLKSMTFENIKSVLNGLPCPNIIC